MTKQLILICGVPGSGKTTEALRLVAECKANGASVSHHEADFYRINERGEYVFDPNKSSDCHIECGLAAQAEMKIGTECVIVANTFIRKWERRPYYHIANDLGYSIKEIWMDGNYQNVHGFPDSVVERMRKSIER